LKAEVLAELKKDAGATGEWSVGERVMVFVRRRHSLIRLPSPFMADTRRHYNNAKMRESTTPRTSTTQHHNQSDITTKQHAHLHIRITTEYYTIPTRHISTTGASCCVSRVAIGRILASRILVCTMLILIFHSDVRCEHCQGSFAPRLYPQHVSDCKRSARPRYKHRTSGFSTGTSFLQSDF
jgi:hypothetical protein